MGGIVPKHSPPSSFSHQKYLPAYFINEFVSQNDITNCSNLWFLILNENTPPPTRRRSSTTSSSPFFSKQFHSCKSWFYSFLYKQILSEIQQQTMIKEFGIDSFLQIMLEMIPPSLLQLTNQHKFTQKIQFNFNYKLKTMNNK